MANVHTLSKRTCHKVEHQGVQGVSGPTSTTRSTIRLRGSLDLEGKIDPCHISLCIISRSTMLLIVQDLQPNLNEGLQYVKNTGSLFAYLDISTDSSVVC